MQTLNRQSKSEARRGSFSSGITEFGDNEIEPYQITISGVIKGMPNDSFYAQKDRLYAFLTSLKDKYIVEGIGVDARRIKLGRLIGDNADEEQFLKFKDDLRAFRLELTFQAKSLWESGLVTTTLTTVTVAAKMTIVNNGTFKTNPIVEVAGSEISRVTISGNGREVRWFGVTDEDTFLPKPLGTQKLIIDCQTGSVKRFISTNNTIQALQEVADNSRMLVLLPGINSLNITTNVAGAIVTFKHRHTYY